MTETSSDYWAIKHMTQSGSGIRRRRKRTAPHGEQFRKRIKRTRSQPPSQPKSRKTKKQKPIRKKRKKKYSDIFAQFRRFIPALANLFILFWNCFVFPPTHTAQDAGQVVEIHHLTAFVCWRPLNLSYREPGNQGNRELGNQGRLCKSVQYIFVLQNHLRRGLFKN